jgi:hypothetical protein
MDLAYVNGLLVGAIMDDLKESRPPKICLEAKEKRPVVSPSSQNDARAC